MNEFIWIIALTSSDDSHTKELETADPQFVFNSSRWNMNIVAGVSMTVKIQLISRMTLRGEGTGMLVTRQ
jgi:hypothetical protein